MYKSRSASMQRGTHRHDRDANLEEVYTKEAGPVLSKYERAHFQFGDRDKNSLLEHVGPLVRAYAKDGYRKPRDVSRLLNKDGVTTACGAKWTPRLAWFLLGFLFEEPNKNKPKNHGVARIPSPRKKQIYETRSAKGRLWKATEQETRAFATDVKLADAQRWEKKYSAPQKITNNASIIGANKGTKKQEHEARMANAQKTKLQRKLDKKEAGHREMAWVKVR
jgi:hypothetical protein